MKNEKLDAMNESRLFLSKFQEILFSNGMLPTGLSPI